ncbi:hypothetical protein D3P07_18435 [Paenibacillus sp. 1011MAR3C5]|uniref:hypothetical protein n=1 Tax=Paenibacillus sp. 1011MAR3C5 TaxID=1675787 RepID=UPI000E6BD18D|nr:hypothetical protein [Paenibacillus sp. 1011MAR3C5]RJE86064.1 hypothetical protein D3P07_18435 [Paenibacillus sp. 1011MAR3C5]
MKIKTIGGVLLLLLGIILLLNQGETFGPGKIFAYFWPSLFVIPLGLLFHWLYFSVTERRVSGLLIPGGVLLTAGFVCQVAMLLGNWEYMWPGFILAPAVGLFEFYWFGKRNKWLLIPINILTVLSLLFFIVFSFGSLFDVLLTKQPYFAILLIIGGAAILTLRKKSD